MQTTEVKKLSINKLSEYPVISLEEQMMLKGGNLPSWLTKVLGWLGLSGGDDNSTNNSYGYGQGNTGSNSSTFNWQPQLFINGERVDPTSNITIYGSDSVKIQYPDGRTVNEYGVDSLKLGK